MKNDLVIRISKVYTVEYHITLEFFVGDGTICLVGMFPCPDTSSHRRLFKSSVRLLHRIDQSYVTMIFFHRLIQEIKDTLCSCQRHNNGVKLLGHLGDRHIKASRQLQERCQCTKGQTAHTIDGQNRTNCQSNHVVDISKVCHNRHQNVGINICIFCTVKKSVVKLIEFLFRLFLMTEYFDHLLAFHHLFNVTVQNSQILLLADKVFSTLGTNLPDRSDHNSNHNNDQQRQGNTQHNHGNERTYNGDHRA